MIKYLGSKRRLLPWITETIEALVPTGTVLDLFSGTSRVGHALKAKGYRVLANDMNAYAHVLAQTYVAADRERWAEEAGAWIARLADVAPRAGWFTETYCERSRYIQPRNGARIEAMREAIAEAALPTPLEAILLTSLMEAADRVDSTTGVQMAYLKAWAPRAERDLALRLPALLPQAAAGPGEAHRLDALEAARRLEADVAYLDPPYNQHSYLGNYHVWESLVRWDAPETYGVACKRVDCKTRKSDFNRKGTFLRAFRDVVAAVRAEHLVVSFSDEGFATPAEIEAVLATRGPVQVLGREQPRYVGARIGIHDPQGVRVGTVGHLTNREHLFVVSPLT